MLCSQMESDGCSTFSPTSTASTPRLGTGTSYGGPRLSIGSRQEYAAGMPGLESQLSFRVRQSVAGDSPTATVLQPPLSFAADPESMGIMSLS